MIFTTFHKCIIAALILVMLIAPTVREVGFKGLVAKVWEGQKK